MNMLYKSCGSGVQAAVYFSINRAFLKEKLKKNVTLSFVLKTEMSTSNSQNSMS